MHKLKEKFMDELYALEERAEKSSARINDADLNKIHKLTDTIKNIDKIEMLEEGGGYSEESNWMADGRMYGTSYDDGSSYARGRRGNVKRDSMGRYSRDMMHHDGDMSYGRDGRMGSMRGGYSRDGGKEEVMELLDEAMSMADSETKHKIRRFKKELEED